MKLFAGDQDYLAFGMVFDAQFCFNVSQYIVDDMLVEGWEEFQLRLVVVNISMDFATVLINDNDGNNYTNYKYTYIN